jgi:hypothetical protein
LLFFSMAAFAFASHSPVRKTEESSIRPQILLATMAVTLAACSTPPRQQTTRIQAADAREFHIITIKQVQLNPLAIGYGSPNKPDSTAEITISGTPAKGEATRFLMRFYPAGDRRLYPAYYDAASKTIHASQRLDALPGWLAALTNIRTNEAMGIVFMKDASGRYEFGTSRLITSK